VCRNINIDSIHFLFIKKRKFQKLFKYEIENHFSIINTIIMNSELVRKEWMEKIETSILNNEWDYFLQLLQNILNRLYSFVKKRPDIINAINAQIPSKLIKQMIYNQAVSVADFKYYFELIMIWIKKLGAPVDDNEVDISIKELKEMKVETFSSVIPLLLLTINDLIDNVQIRREYIIANRKN